eukprot:scaffold34966_cov30-Tisochrysis_lutea.AAC.3
MSRVLAPAPCRKRESPPSAVCYGELHPTPRPQDLHAYSQRPSKLAMTKGLCKRKRSPYGESRGVHRRRRCGLCL